MKAERTIFSAKKLTGLAVMLALVIVLQLWGNVIKIGTTSLCFVLVPIVLAAVLYGPVEGAILGFVFGLITLISGISGTDSFTMILFDNHPIITSVLCLLKGTLAGLIPGIAYKIISKKNSYAGVITASALAPVVNTSLFIFGALFMSDTLSANFVLEGTSVIYFLIIGCAGWNFIAELVINLILAPAMFTVVRVVSRNIAK